MSDSDPGVGVGTPISLVVVATGYCTPTEVAEFLMQLGVTSATWPDTDLFQRHINLSAAEIDVALQTSNQYTCSKTTQAADLLKYLNLICTVLITEFPNVRSQISGDTLKRFQKWKDNMVKGLRLGELVVCQGETGENYPAIEIAEQAWTDATAMDIILNKIKRLAV